MKRRRFIVAGSLLVAAAVSGCTASRAGQAERHHDDRGSRVDRARGRRRSRSPSSRSRRGYQDPHFVEAKPSFILKLQKRRPAGRRRPRAGDRLAAAAHPAEPQREDPAGRARLSRRVAAARGFSTSRTGQITRAMGDVHPLGNPHYWLDPENGKRIAQAIAAKLSQLRPNDKAYFDAAAGRLHARLDAAREALAGDDGAVQGHRRW